MGFMINIFDESGNKIPDNCIEIQNVYDECDWDELNITIKNSFNNLSRDEHLLLMLLIKDKIEYGVGMDENRKLLDLYDKIKKGLDKK